MSDVKKLDGGKTPWRISDVVYAYLFVFIASILIMGFLLFFDIGADVTFFSAFLQVSLSVLTLIAIYYIITRKYSLSFPSAMGIKRKNLSRDFFTGFSVSFMLVISTTLVSYIFIIMGIIPESGPYTNIPSEKLRIISVLAVFLAPFVEEIFFRGFMQPALINAFGNFGGIFITALIFGFSHSQYLDYSNALVAVTVIGLILGTTRQLTGSIMPGIFAHLFNNLYASLSLY